MEALRSSRLFALFMPLLGGADLWIGRLLLRLNCLLKAGANFNARMANGKTVLHVFVEGHEEMGGTTSREDREVVMLLLDHGVDFGAADDEGQTALMTAERIGKQDIAQLLKDRM